MVREWNRGESAGCGVGRTLVRLCGFFFFFFNDTATTEIYTLSLHDALPICNKKWSVKKAGTLPQLEPGSIKSRALPHQ